MFLFAAIEAFGDVTVEFELLFEDEDELVDDVIEDVIDDDDDDDDDEEEDEDCLFFWPKSSNEAAELTSS